MKEKLERKKVTFHVGSMFVGLRVSGGRRVGGATLGGERELV